MPLTPQRAATRCVGMGAAAAAASAELASGLECESAQARALYLKVVRQGAPPLGRACATVRWSFRALARCAMATLQVLHDGRLTTRMTCLAVSIAANGPPCLRLCEPARGLSPACPRALQ